MRIKHFFSALFISAISATNFSHAGDLTTKEGLFDLYGNWSGRGTSVISDSPEKVSCRGSAIPKKERLEVAITCNAASGSGRLVAYIGLDDETRSISGVWHQAFEGKQGQTRGKLTGTATDSKTLAMLLNTYGKDRASVVFNQISENQLNIKIREVGADNRATFDVSFKR